MYAMARESVRTMSYRRGWWLALLVLLTAGCATKSGKPMGGKAAFTAMRYRPATPQEAPDTVARHKKAQQSAQRVRGAEEPFPMPAPAPPMRRIVLTSDKGLTVGESTEQTVQGYDVPGRQPDSRMPWEFFLGNAAHRLIAYMYGVNHPRHRVFYNQETLAGMLLKVGIGDPSLLHENERNLRPDITDFTSLALFEIKPWHEQALQEGRLEVRLYLTALNRALPTSRNFSGGTGFQGEILIRFAQGQHIWRLEWWTPESGVVQYRWTRSQQSFASEAAAYKAGQWVEISAQEMRQYGGWVSQAVEGMVSRRERLATFSGVVGVAIDLVGNVAVGVFSGIIGRVRPGPQQPPTQAGGQIIRFPPRVPSTAPAPPLPAASGM